MEPSIFERLTLYPPRIVNAPVTPMTAGLLKVRPVVLLSQPESNDPDCLFDVVAGSKSPPTLANARFAVMVPGLSEGHPDTKLFHNTWFYAGWIRTVHVGEVVSLYGEFPTYQYSDLVTIIRKLAESK